MDHLNPDPPEAEEIVYRSFDAHFDGVGSISTMTDPPLSESPLEKHCMSFSSAANSGSQNTNTDNQDTNNDNDIVTYFTSNDQPKTNNDTLTQDDELILSMAFPQHSFMVKYFQEYSTCKGVLLMEQYKQCFTTEEFCKFFPGESNHSLNSNPSPNQNKNHARRGYFFCSRKSHGRIKGVECCFCVAYFWDASNGSFVISSNIVIM
jgi:hypothetical protein